MGKLSARLITAIVAEKHGVTHAEMMQRSRLPRLVAARQEASRSHRRMEPSF
jgi:chromosomal replication initiation ATPase DnaA